MWSEEFPGMTVITKSRAVNVCFPLVSVLAIYRDNRSGTYIPKLFVHNLCYGTDHFSGDITVTDTRQFHSYYKISDNSEKYKETEEYLRNNLIIPLSSDICINEVINIFKTHFDNAYEYEKFTILRGLSYLASWSGKEDIIDDITGFTKQRNDLYEKIKPEIPDNNTAIKNAENSLKILKLDKLPSHKIIL